jgi:hypothetical protein
MSEEQATPAPDPAESPKEPPKPSALIVAQEPVVCGCVWTHYADKRKTLSPCLACGLAGVAVGLEHAVAVLQAMSDRARKEQANQQVFAAAAVAAHKQQRRG